MAGLCEAVGADVLDLVLGIGYDKRIGFEFLRPGPGWGGSCLPKDTAALVAISNSAGYDVSIVRGAISGNEDQMRRVVGKIAGAAGGDARGPDRRGRSACRSRRTPATAATRPPSRSRGCSSSEGATVHAFDPTVTSDGRRTIATSRT